MPIRLPRIHSYDSWYSLPRPHIVMRRHRQPISTDAKSTGKSLAFPVQAGDGFSKQLQALACCLSKSSPPKELTCETRIVDGTIYVNMPL